MDHKQLLTLILIPCSISISQADQSLNGTFVNSATLKPQIIRDPFTPSDLMYETLSTQSLSGGLGNGFIPGQGAIKVPQMRLKGFLGETKDDRIALLEVDGKNTYMVRVGDEINYDPLQPRSAIRITEINRLSVTVETGVMGTIKVLR